MKPIRYKTWIATLLLAAPGLFILPAGEAGASMRCDGKLVQTGDRKFEVREVCGEPDVVIPLHTVYTARYGHVPTREEWQYNFGPHRLTRFLRFQQGRLTHIKNGPHGFRTLDGNCRPGDIDRGISQLELKARCGEPREVEVIAIDRTYRIEGVGMVFQAGLPAEEWIYEFGSGRFPRIVTVVNGRVVEVERARRRN